MITRADIMGAIGRAYATTPNAAKAVDIELAETIADVLLEKIGPPVDDRLRLTLLPTATITGLVAELGKDVQARVWEGTDDQGTKVVAFIARVAVSEDEAPEAHERFLKALKETPKPRAADVWPGRMIP